MNVSAGAEQLVLPLPPRQFPSFSHSPGLTYPLPWTFLPLLLLMWPLLLVSCLPPPLPVEPSSSFKACLKGYRLSRDPSWAPVRSAAASVLPELWGSISGQHAPHFPSRCSWGDLVLPYLLLSPFFLSLCDVDMSAQLPYTPTTSVSFVGGARSPHVRARADPPGCSSKN